MIMCRTSSEDDGEKVYQEPLGIPDAMLLRGSFLSQLRKIAEADERERESAEAENELLVDEIDYLSDGQSVLRYESYLSHQRYYDDLKHVDCDFIDFGKTPGGSCVIRQDKSLGKGGFCWDAALILADHLMAMKVIDEKDSVIELGAGTGLCGVLLAKASRCNVEISDLPELLPLMQRNVALNFSDTSKILYSEDDASILRLNGNHKAVGSCVARTLDWGDKNYEKKYSVIIGADVVASLYDPVKLAEMIHSLCQVDSKVFISCKSRLDKPHQFFEARMEELFESVQITKPTGSRNKNPDVFIFQASKPLFSSN